VIHEFAHHFQFQRSYLWRRL